MTDLLDKVKSEAEKEEETELELAKNEIILKITDEINKRIITEEEQIKAALTYDKQVIEAMKILEDPVLYRSLLVR